MSKKHSVVSVLKRKENRGVLVGLGFLLAVVAVVVGITVLKHLPASAPSEIVSAESGRTSSAAVATGKETEEYLKEVRRYNAEVLPEDRKTNRSAHPLPLIDKFDAESCQANHDAWMECLRATGALDDADCAITDTQCMIANGLIGPDDCAPGDLACKKAKGHLGQEVCDEANYSCIARRAAEVGCAMDDTACLRRHGIIGPDACAPEDDACRAARSSGIQCQPDDIDCIRRLAALAGCEMDDTECLRRNGIIGPEDCAPEDAQCQLLKNLGVKCAPDDLECIARHAAEAGCALDDTDCLRRNGIIGPGACAPLDKQCKEAQKPCEPNDIECIRRRAAEAGCTMDDTACLRAAGIIGQDECAPEDRECRAEKAGALACAKDDIECIRRRAAEAGCAMDDTDCLRRNGIIGPDECAPEDQKCKMSNRSAECLEDDMTCLAKAAADKGCALSDTECLRRNVIIEKDECAPFDQECRRERGLGAIGATNALRGGSTRDDRYVQALTRNAREDRTVAGGSSAGSVDREFDQAYMDQAIDFLGRRAPSRKPTEIHVVFRSQDNQSEGRAAPRDSDRLPDLRTGDPAQIESDQGPTGKRLLKAGDVRYAVSDLSLSTDYMGPVSLTMLESGDLYGARLLGEMVHVDEKVRLELDRMVKRDGTIIPINAIALDTKTTYAAVASRVNRHIMYRYGWWGVGTVLSAVGKASAMRAEQAVIVPDAGVAKSNDLDSQGEMKVALGELGEDIGEVFKDRIDRPITVEVDRGMELGVFFMDAVFDEVGQQ